LLEALVLKITICEFLATSIVLHFAKQGSSLKVMTFVLEAATGFKARNV